MDKMTQDYRAYFEAISAPCAVLDDGFRFVEVNQAYCDTVLRPCAELLGRNVWDAFPEAPERQARQKEMFRKALAGEGSSLSGVPYAIAVPEEEGGGYREIWWRIHATPVAGPPPRFVLRVQDITSEVLAQDFSDTIAGEFRHRVGNLFSIVMTIARQTAQNSADLDEFIDRYGARIQSLSRTHMALTGQDWNGMSLQRLVELELDAYNDGKRDDIEISGPDLRLSAAEAQAMSMALHELATNAAKYGAFKHDQGRLRVSWAVLAPDGYEFEWHETQLSGIRTPDRAGFGSLMLTSILPSQLNGQATREFAETGHFYRLCVPERLKSA